MQIPLLLASTFLAGTIHAGSTLSTETKGTENTCENSPQQETQLDFDEAKFQDHLKAWHDIQIKNVEYYSGFEIRKEDQEEVRVPRNCWSTPLGVQIPMSHFKSLLRETDMAEREPNEPEFASEKRQRFKRLLEELPNQLPHHNSFSKVYQEILNRWNNVKDLLLVRYPTPRCQR